MGSRLLSSNTWILNQWVVLAGLIPRDDICSDYLKLTGGTSNTDRPPLSPRIVLGSLIIKHLCNIDDRERVDHITEKTCTCSFFGILQFYSASPFDASPFVTFRKMLGTDNVNAINEKTVAVKTRMESSKQGETPSDKVKRPTGDIVNGQRQCPNGTTDNIPDGCGVLNLKKVQ